MQVLVCGLTKYLWERNMFAAFTVLITPFSLMESQSFHKFSPLLNAELGYLLLLARVSRGLGGIAASFNLALPSPIFTSSAQYRTEISLRLELGRRLVPHSIAGSHLVQRVRRE